MLKVILICLAAVNLIGAAAVLLDKHRARRGAWRVRERTFFLLGALGGVPGVYGAMRLVHHKTLHRRFMWGLPALLLLQLAALGVLWYHFPAFFARMMEEITR